MTDDQRGDELQNCAQPIFTFEVGELLVALHEWRDADLERILATVTDMISTPSNMLLQVVLEEPTDVDRRPAEACP